MTLVKLKYVDRFRDRHGQWRYYFRRGKGARIVLPESPGTPEFMLAYQSALELPENKAEVLTRGAPGTFDRLVQDYYSSPDYLRLAEHTRHVYRLVIERLLRDEQIGHRLVKQMSRGHVARIVGKRAATPGAANDVLKKVKILMHFAVDHGWRKDDPTVRVKGFGEGEFHTWTDAEIAAYEVRWEIGTRARTAFALLVFTGQRLADVARMAWTDVEGNALRLAQGKTKVRLWVPMHAELSQALSAWPKSHVTIITTNFGKAFSTKGFGNWMADRIADAGLPERCVTHGLRKAAARRLAEAGCSANEIQSITGHKTLKEVSRYTKAAEQRHLATAAIARLSKQKANENSQT
jgi:enterobacteria phage integrase